MSTTDTSPSNVQWLAKRLEDDIHIRGLRPGEPYLTTAQAGRQLGISKAMAYRAMKILADRKILISHPGRGTFIGPEVSDAPVGAVKCIYLLMTHDYFQSVGLGSHGWLAGLSATMPEYSVQFNFLPNKNPESQVAQLLEQGVQQGTLAAVVLLGCPQTVQELVLNRGVPALVMGTDYSSARRLPSVDADQFELGRIAAEYLLSRGHKRIALLMREMWFPGDRRFFEGVGRALDEAGLGHNALMLRNLSVDAAVLDAELRRLLTEEIRPTGCVCRAAFFAGAIVRAAETVGLKVPGDIDVVTDGHDRHTAASLHLPSVCMKVSVEEETAIGGRMIMRLFAGEKPDPLHVVLPVELVEPDLQGRKRRKSSL